MRFHLDFGGFGDVLRRLLWWTLTGEGEERACVDPCAFEKLHKSQGKWLEWEKWTETQAGTGEAGRQVRVALVDNAKQSQLRAT